MRLLPLTSTTLQLRGALLGICYTDSQLLLLQAETLFR